jgi:ATP-dependent Lon protease
LTSVAGKGREEWSYFPALEGKTMEQKQYERQINALFLLLKDILGQEVFEKRVKSMELTDMIKSNKFQHRISALQRLVLGDEHNGQQYWNVEQRIEAIEGQIADMMARRVVEQRIQEKIAQAMEQKQRQYMDEMKLQILKKTSGPENANTLKKYALLEKLEVQGLSRLKVQMIRPSRLEDIVGQSRAVKALLSKIANPFPQHVLIYGPPGVGKTTTARLVLEVAKKMKYTPFSPKGKFVEVDGTTLRWDPREITNPLLGSVHDPIYQGTKRELAETGIPEPKTGLVTEAHGGVLFIDEIGELDTFLQNKLLKVLEDKRIYFDSSYYDPDDDSTPKYVKKLFDEGAPADFILIGATTKHPWEINPALRSRCAEVFFEPLTPEHIQDIVTKVAHRTGIKIDRGVPGLISRYTIEGRKAVSILTDAYGLALYNHGDSPDLQQVMVKEDDVYQVVQVSRLVPNNSGDLDFSPQVGKVYGLGVNGYVGSVIEFESIAFPVDGRGSLKFNDTAGSMAKDSVVNASVVIRKLTGKDLSKYDIHINAVGGGKIDGPSAGAAMVMLILSAIEQRPLRQDIAITGEISLQGRVKEVGGIHEKIYGAIQAGMKGVILPKANLKDVPEALRTIDIIGVEDISQVLDIMFNVNNR